MNKDQKQNIFDLRGQNVEQQDSVILTKNNFNTMLEIVKQSIGSISLYDIKELLRGEVKIAQSRDELVQKMNSWVESQNFLDWVTKLKTDELKPSTGTEIVDYPNEPVQPVNSFKSKIVDSSPIDYTND